MQPGIYGLVGPILEWLKILEKFPGHEDSICPPEASQGAFE